MVIFQWFVTLIAMVLKWISKDTFYIITFLFYIYLEDRLSIEEEEEGEGIKSE